MRNVLNIKTSQIKFSDPQKPYNQQNIKVRLFLEGYGWQTIYVSYRNVTIKGDRTDILLCNMYTLYPQHIKISGEAIIEAAEAAKNTYINQKHLDNAYEQQGIEEYTLDL